MPSPIPYPALKHYLEHLHHGPHAGTRMWLDTDGSAQGQFFNATLTSAFQPIHDLGKREVVGYEGVARSYPESERGLNVWKMLEQASNDDESIELDRMCRMLHAINFFRQPAAQGRDLYLSVHQRLLAAVDSNHGFAFRRILDALGVSPETVVLQLPAGNADPAWLVNYVADNYRVNGFRLAVKINRPAQGLALLARVRPEAVKLDARALLQDPDASKLVSECGRLGIRLIAKRVENAQLLQLLELFAGLEGESILAQGAQLGQPGASLAIPGVANPEESSGVVQPHEHSFSFAGEEDGATAWPLPAAGRAASA
jgi:EAL domain-containing protein (putative c-di-GMP-specific phosphodiesterase class I)